LETDKEVEPQDITCPTCHGEKFEVVDGAAGLLRCAFCHNQWTDSRFIQTPENEKITREHINKTLFGKEHTIESREVIHGTSSTGEATTKTVTTTTTTKSNRVLSPILRLPRIARFILTMILGVFLFLCIVSNLIVHT
jgi:pyruvate-formate lyase-activating enzyme